jgi:hypothetical protein
MSRHLSERQVSMGTCQVEKNQHTKVLRMLVWPGRQRKETEATGITSGHWRGRLRQAQATQQAGHKQELQG